MGHVLFLDANVLFSAAYRAETRLRELWTLPDTELITSGYAWHEAETNLPQRDQVKRLHELAPGLRIVPEGGAWALPPDVILPDKDRPILASAIVNGATHLITGDAMHFGVWFDKLIGNLLVMRPGPYLLSRVASQEPVPA